MDRQEILGVALANVGASEILVESTSLFHGVDHVDERVVSFFNFTTANWRELELVVFKNI